MAQKRSTSDLWFCKNSIKPPREGGGGGRRGSILGGGVPPGSPNPDPISDQNIFYTRFQTWPLKSILLFRPAILEIMVSLLRLKDEKRYFLKAILNSCIFSFGIETTNIYIHALPYLENHTRFQTQNGQNVWHEILHEIVHLAGV